MCDDSNSVFQAKNQYLYSKIWEFGGRWGQGVKISGRKCHIWNRRPWFAYSLCNFYGATMTIKGSLLSIFRRKKTKSSMFWAKIWLFGGINRVLILNLSFMTPKRHILAWFHVWCRLGPKLAGVWARGASKKIWDPCVFLQLLKLATSNLVHELGLGPAYQKTTFRTEIGGGLGQGSIQKMWHPYLFLHHWS